MFAFIHIPKTAGTSVKHQLIKSGRLRVLNVKNQNNFKTNFFGKNELFGDLSANFDGIVGHIVFKTWWAKKVEIIVSVVREPVSRAVSLTNFIRSTPDNNLHEVVNRLGFKSAFTESAQFRNLLYNSQYRALFGGNPAETAALKAGLQAAEFSNHFRGRFAMHKYLVGSLENYPDFCTEVNGRLGSELRVDVRMKSRDKAEDYVFDDEDLDILSRYNQMDMMLHEFIQTAGVVHT